MQMITLLLKRRLLRLTLLMSSLFVLMVLPQRLLAHTSPPPLPKATPKAHWTTPYAWPPALALYPVVVTDFSSGDISLLGDRTLITSGGPHGIAIQPGGRFLWDINAEHSVPSSPIMPVTASRSSRRPHCKQIAVIPTGAGPHGVTASAVGHFVFVANTWANTMTVIATNTMSPLAPVPVGGFPTDIAVLPALHP